MLFDGTGYLPLQFDANDAVRGGGDLTRINVFFLSVFIGHIFQESSAC